MLLSWLDRDYGFGGQEDNKDLVSSHHIKGTYYQCDFPLLMLSTGWKKRYLSGFSGKFQVFLRKFYFKMSCNIWSVYMVMAEEKLIKAGKRRGRCRNNATDGV